MDTTVILDIIGNVFVLAGVLIFSIAAIGLFRFTDTYQRISAVGTAAGLGISVLVIGVFILTPSWQNLIKLLIILFLQLATSSIGSMAIARSAYLTGSPLRPGHFDHLAEDQGVVEDIGEPDEDVEEPEENVDEAAQNDNWG
ncbi:MAG TPA: monovalent cation/H(+) antiporter subunit G [Candidatus Yaniella excrementigallinarum]|nr:monovalent cation/H(+) antiporter subunit G [Candidatus Yaniella excrementigallinarum]